MGRDLHRSLKQCVTPARCDTNSFGLFQRVWHPYHDALTGDEIDGTYWNRSVSPKAMQSPFSVLTYPNSLLIVTTH